jgi:hypothetical protein
MKKVRQMNDKVLTKTYGTYPIVNGFEGADFGSWAGGIYEATLDDFMHSTELGVIKSINEVVFKGLTKTECKQVESMMRSYLGDVRSSCRSTYPRWRLTDGFSRQTLMTSTERVGTLFSLCLGLQSQEIQEVVSAAHTRQRKKYMTFAEPPIHANAQDASHLYETDNMVDSDQEEEEEEDDVDEEEDDEEEDDIDDKSDEEMEDNNLGLTNNSNSVARDMSQAEYYFEKHFQRNLTPTQIEHALEHVMRHSYDLEQVKSFDILQVNQFVAQAHILFKKKVHTYPKRSIEGYYHHPEEDTEVKVPEDVLRLAIQSVQFHPEDVLGSHRFDGVESVIPKHFKRKQKIKRIGNTEAILCSDPKAVILFLELLLFFHAFAKYSSSLPTHLRDNFANVHNGSRMLVRYIERMFYRGDDSIDYRTTKLHCHRRFGQNYEDMRCIVHFSTELGERLLKTEAKGVSRTAQQRGESTFHYQTADRIAERQVMESLGDFVDDVVAAQNDNNMQPTNNRFSRRLPHFVFSRANPTVKAVSRHGKTSTPDDITGTIPGIVKRTLLVSEPHMNDFEIYNEAILRNDSGYVRAFPKYRNESPFYDFVMIKWEEGTYPGKVVCFYNKPVDDAVGNAGLFALVHVVDETTAGKVEGFTNTLLCTHYNMSYTRRQPTLYKVALESIEHTVLAFAHERSPHLFNHNKQGVCIVRPRNEWAYLWLAWNEVLHEENSKEVYEARNRRDNRRYVSLNDESVLERVIETFDHMLSSRNKE